MLHVVCFAIYSLLFCLSGHLLYLVYWKCLSVYRDVRFEYFVIRNKSTDMLLELRELNGHLQQLQTVTKLVNLIQHPDDETLTQTDEELKLEISVID